MGNGQKGEWVQKRMVKSKMGTKENGTNKRMGRMKNGKDDTGLF
jgi:hypothetical protein